MWLERPRVRWWALAASAAFVLYLIVSTPYKMEFHFYSDAPGPRDPRGGEPPSRLDAAHRAARAALDARDLGGADRAAALPRQRATRKELTAVVAVAAIGVLAWTVTGADLGGDRLEQLLERLHPEHLAAARLARQGDGRQADALPRAEHHRPERALDPRVLEPLDQARLEPRRHGARPGPDPDPGPRRNDGRLFPTPKVVYAVTDPGVDVVGTVVATHNHKNAASTIPWRLVKIAQPLRLAHAQTGIETDGWVVSPDGVKPAKAAYSQFVTPGKRPGYARVVVTRRGWGGTDVPGLVTIKLGKLVKGKDKQPALGKVLAVHRFWIHSREYKRVLHPGTARAVPSRGDGEPDVRPVDARPADRRHATSRRPGRVRMGSADPPPVGWRGGCGPCRLTECGRMSSKNSKACI